MLPPWKASDSGGGLDGSGGDGPRPRDAGRAWSGLRKGARAGAAEGNTGGAARRGDSTSAPAQDARGTAGVAALKRSGFKRKPCQQVGREARQCTYIPRPREIARPATHVARPVIQAPKERPLQHEGYMAIVRQAAAVLPVQVEGRDAVLPCRRGQRREAEDRLLAWLARMWASPRRRCDTCKSASL